MRTTIYLIRHGECAGNREGLFRGRFDFPLNDVGLKQARWLAQELREVAFDAIYTSPLKRAWETAETLSAERGFEPEVQEGLNNIDLGEWEGKPKKEIAENFPREFRLWRTEPEKLAMEGAETLAQVQNRAVKVLVRLVGEHPGETIAVVTHRAVIKPLVAGILGLPEPYFWKLHPETASYSVIEHTPERGFSLFMLNQTKHLEEYIREDT